MHRTGYGPLLVPPLAVIIVFCFGYFMAASHMADSRSRTAAAQRSRRNEHNRSTYHNITPTNLQPLPTLEAEKTPAPTTTQSIPPKPAGVRPNNSLSSKSHYQDATVKEHLPESARSGVEDTTRSLSKPDGN